MGIGNYRQNLKKVQDELTISAISIAHFGRIVGEKDGMDGHSKRTDCPE